MVLAKETVTNVVLQLDEQDRQTLANAICLIENIAMLNEDSIYVKTDTNLDMLCQETVERLDKLLNYRNTIEQ